MSSNIYRCIQCIPNKKLLQLRDECSIVQYQYFGLLIQRYGWLFLASLRGCHARVSDGSSDHVFVADLASRPLKHTLHIHGKCIQASFMVVLAVFLQQLNTVCLQSIQEEAVMYQIEASKARPSCYVDDLSPRAQDLDLEHSLALSILQELETIANFSVILHDFACIL